MRAERPAVMTEDHPVYLEAILGLTAFAAGAVDIISFAKLGGIFASAMTGNLAFLGLYLSQGSFHAALGSCIALGGFVIGAASGHRLAGTRDRSAALNMLLAAETLFLVGVVVIWASTRHDAGGKSTDALITLLSVSMGMQSIIGKRVNLSNIPTIVFTSTLTNLVIGITDSLSRGAWAFSKDTKRQAASFSLYFLGALLAGLCVYVHIGVLVALPAVAIAVAFLVAVKHRPAGI